MASSVGAFQKEIDGILSPNNIWLRIFCPPGDKMLIENIQL
jgi:hypothetical protein